MSETILQYGRKFPTGRIEWELGDYLQTPEQRREANDSFRLNVETSGVILTDEIQLTFVTREATYGDPVDLPVDPDPVEPDPDDPDPEDPALVRSMDV